MTRRLFAPLAAEVRPLADVGPRVPRPLFLTSPAEAAVAPSGSTAWPLARLEAAPSSPAAATPPAAVPPSAGASADAEADARRALDEASATGERAGRQAAAAQVQAMQARLADSLARLGEVARRVARPSPHEIVELALIAARELVGREVSVDREHLCAQLAEHLAGIPDDEGPRVRVSRDDLAWILAHQPERFQGVRLVEDPALAAGGCIVETTRRIIDASIEARVDAVRAAMVAALRSAPAPSDAELDAGGALASPTPEVTP